MAEARAAAEALGLPLRLKLPTGGYDGRGQIRIADRRGAGRCLGVASASQPGAALLAERELEFAMELSVIVARGGDEVAVFPLGRNVHDAGVLVQTGVAAPVTPEVAADAVSIGTRLAVAMDLQGTLTVELFLMPDDTLVVNELAPRVHNSGHWTIEGAATSQFEQHIRAICGLGLGSPAAHGPAAMVNLLGTGPRRAARLLGVAEALADPAVHLHLYDKREVFERRKMGHLTALGTTTDLALASGPRGADQAPLGRRHDEGGGRPMTEGSKGDGPVVGVVGGSRSDFPTLEAAVAVLEELGVRSELKVVSAHRTPDRLFRYAEEAAGRGLLVIIAGAGGAAHLPGMLASKTALPVIGVPIPTEHLGGLDSLLSIVQMPRGVPVATVGIGNATNAGLLAAAILATSDPDLAERLAAWRARQTQAVLDDPTNG